MQNTIETAERIPYQWVREAMKKANEKYRSSHREEYNLCQKKYYDAHKTDPEYMQRMRKKAREYYHRKKAEKRRQMEPDGFIL
jgi:hypothetical protein